MGDADTNKDLLSRAPMLRQFIAHRLPPELRRTVAVEDILQEVWVRAHRFMLQGGRDLIDSLDGWLITLTSNVLVDELRSHQTAKRGGRQQQSVQANHLSYFKLFNRIASSRNTPSTEVAVVEAVRLVQSALDCLPGELGQVVRMRHLEGLSYEQIAAQIDRSVPAVRGLLTRGLAKLRVELRSAGRFFSDAASSIGTCQTTE